MKPRIICYMMSTVDGRLDVTRYSLPVNGERYDTYIEYYFDKGVRPERDAVMIGRRTLQEMYMPDLYEAVSKKPAHDLTTFIAKPLGAGTPTIVVDIKGKTLFEGHEDMHFITILGDEVSDEYLAHLREKKVSYVFAGPKGKELGKAMDILATEFGYKTIALEGGGTLNGTFLKAGLIDELHLLLYPSIDGLAGMPSIFEYMGTQNEKPAEGQTLKLVSVEEQKYGTVLLKYDFRKL